MNKRILLADDNEDIRTMLEITLRDAGHSVDSAPGGESALGKFRKALNGSSPYDLLLLDAAMPDLTGYQVTEAVRKSDPEVPVILFTGRDDLLTVPHARAVGVTKVLIKPLGGPELQAEIAEALAQAESNIVDEIDTER